MTVIKKGYVLQQKVKTMPVKNPCHKTRQGFVISK